MGGGWGKEQGQELSEPGQLMGDFYSGSLQTAGALGFVRVSGAPRGGRGTGLVAVIVAYGPGLPQGWQSASLHRGCRVARQAGPCGRPWAPTGWSSASEGGNSQGGWATATPGGGLSGLGSGRLASSG